MSAKQIRETDLYPPIKTLLESQGYEVKGEVGDADIVGMRGDEDPVIVELKTGFSLALFHQAVERQALTDTVYVAVPRQTGAASYKALQNNLKLCRRLGLGLITVRMKDGFTEIHLDPAPYRPRKSEPKRARLLKEFARRVGDPNAGGSNRSGAGNGLITAYRQDALRCLKLLSENGPTKASDVAKATDVENARRIMADDHYGWFERKAVGIYMVTPIGRQALIDYAQELAKLPPPPDTARSSQI